MLERYIGRKTAPKLNIETKEPREESGRAWWEGATKDPEFAEWFSGSVVTDASGNPIPVFHGTRGSHSFDDVYNAGVRELGMHFGTVEAANTRFDDTFDSLDTAEHPEKTYEYLRNRILKSSLNDAWKQEELAQLERDHREAMAEYQERQEQRLLGGEKIYPVFLRITNPVRLTDAGSFVDEHMPSIKKDLVKNFLPRDHIPGIQATKTIEELRAALIELGYDGVVYKNGVEGDGTDSFIPIVGSEQIRSVFSSAAPQEKA